MRRRRICACGATLGPRRRKCDPCVRAARAQHSSSGYSTYETLEARARHRRMVEILAKEPDLETWQLAERLGLTIREASNLRSTLDRRRAVQEAHA